MQLLIEKIEQINWTLTIACKICKVCRCSELDPNYIKSISYGRANDKQTHTTLLHKFHYQKCDFSSQMGFIRFNFQDNHENSSSGEPYYNPQYGFSEAATGALL